MDDYGNGIPAREEPPEEAGRSDLSQEGSRERLLSRISACAFALYSLLLFLLFLAPVEKISYAGFGASANVYQAGLGICTSLIVFAALSLAVSLLGLAIELLPALARAKSSLLGKIVRVLPLFFYFLLYSLACALTGATSLFGGTGGAAPALILSFTIVFALVHIACLLLPKYKK